MTIPTRESAARALPKLERSAGDAPGLEGRGPLRLLFVCFTILAVGFFLRALHIVWKYREQYE